nr:hypothetical protein KPHV_85490 [Kitasatospora purpeofusca]
MPTPSPGAEDRVAELELRGFLVDGYSKDDTTEVLAPLSEATGLHIVCLWDHVDRWGCGGASDWFVVGPDGRLHHLAGALFAWLNWPDGSSGPGRASEWVGADSGVTTGDLIAVNPYNYARVPRRA